MTPLLPHKPAQTVTFERSCSPGLAETESHGIGLRTSDWKLIGVDNRLVSMHASRWYDMDAILVILVLFGWTKQAKYQDRYAVQRHCEDHFEADFLLRRCFPPFKAIFTSPNFPYYDSNVSQNDDNSKRFPESFAWRVARHQENVP